jgi:hypothetical protein
MMDANDKKQFLQMLTKAMGAYGKPLPDAGIIGAWVDVLTPYPLQVIGMAFAAYCDENGEFAPVPAGIAKRCKVMDGRPGPEEAWAMLPTDESQSTAWTDEMAQAWGIALPLIEDGDRIAARMAFKETYAKLVTAARDQKQPIRWSMSFGDDKNSRQTALADAVRLKRIQLDSAIALLPPDAAEGLIRMLDIKSHPLLAPPTSKGREQLKMLMNTMRVSA